MEPNIFNLAIILDDLEKASGTNEKKKILEKYMKHGDSMGLQQLFVWTLASKYTFGLTNWENFKFRRQIKDAKEATPELLRSLIARSLTGHAARDLTGTMAECLDEQAQLERLYTGNVKPSEALRRVITKDLRVGVGASLVNSVIPGLIPVFEVQLAPSEQPLIDNLVYPLAVEPKYDGMRLVALPTAADTFEFFSRDGELKDNFEEMEDLFKALIPPGYVVDGEIVDKVSSFSSLISRSKAGRGTKTDKASLLSYIVFDMLTVDEWERRVVPPPYEDRRKRIEELLNQHVLFDLQEESQSDIQAKYGRTPALSISPMTIVRDKDQFLSVYEDYLKITPEGIIVKTLKGSYEFDRTKVWEKMKPMIEGDGEIIGVDEGGTGKNKGLLKSVTIKGMFSDPRRGYTSAIECIANVGSGFDDAQRKYITEEYRAGRLIGRIIDLQFQEIWQSKQGKIDGTYSLRFPTFLRFRGEVPGEKL